MKRKSEKGMTLVELLVAAFVFSLVMGLTALTLRGGQEQARYTETRMHLDESLRQALYQMNLDLREAAPSRTTLGNGGASLTIQTPAAVSNSGNITWSNALTFQVGGNGRQLVKTDAGTGQTTVLANDIQSVTFTAAGNPMATIQYVLTARRALWNGRNLSASSTGEARLRNA